MSTPRAGPELPPHLLAKRKHQAEANATPNLQTSYAGNDSQPSTPDGVAKRRRVIGPYPPPAPLNEKPHGLPNPHNENSDEDNGDGYGPSLPTKENRATQESSASRNDLGKEAVDQVDRKTRRDDWMTMPPKQDDLAARLDPTKQRPRGFNTGKSAKGSSQGGVGDNAIWTETPEQKRKRLEDEILGVSQPASIVKDDQQTQRSRAEDEEKARKIREYNEKHRSKSLIEQHKGSTVKQKEDDPSKRGFDYEKDMATGTKIGHAQKREMLNRAADFGSRFSKGSFL